MQCLSARYDYTSVLMFYRTTTPPPPSWRGSSITEVGRTWNESERTMAGSRCRSQTNRRRCGPWVRSVSRPSSSSQAEVSRTLASRFWMKGLCIIFILYLYRILCFICTWFRTLTRGVFPICRIFIDSNVPKTLFKGRRMSYQVHVYQPVNERWWYLFLDYLVWFVLYVWKQISLSDGCKAIICQPGRVLYVETVPHKLNVACWKSVSGGGRECVRVAVICPYEAIHYVLTEHFTARRVTRLNSRVLGQDASEFPQGKNVYILCRTFFAPFNPAGSCFDWWVIGANSPAAAMYY